MTKLSRSDLWSLEEYSELRPTFRARVMAHKKTRQVALGDHARLYFEDGLTIKYQIQEMLRIEKVFEAAGINEELAATAEQLRALVGQFQLGGRDEAGLSTSSTGAVPDAPANRLPLFMLSETAQGRDESTFEEF